MELLLNDVRLSARTLLRTPDFAWIAILVIALGVGANVALFAIVRDVYKRQANWERVSAAISGVMRLTEV